MKAVIPAAGLGTRCLPATKSMPKEMLPVVDKPVIQYVVEEAVASGCDEILLVTGRGKRAIEDHFDKSFELEHHLEQDGKTERLKRVREISDLADIHYVRQAEKFVGQEPFVVLLGDDIFHSETPATRQLLDVHERTGGGPAFTVKDVPREDIGRYGCVDGHPVDEGEGVYAVDGIVEKPEPKDAPSTLATMGRYVFTPEIFDMLRKTEPGHGGEIQLTDAMHALAQRQDMHAATFEGTRLDVGTIEGFIETNVALALKRGTITPERLEEIAEAATNGLRTSKLETQP